MGEGTQTKSKPKSVLVTNPNPLTAEDVLEKLANCRELVITQDKEKQLADWACSPMTYFVCDKENPDTVLFLVAEDTSCCCTFFCGPARQSTISILAPNYQEIVTLVRRACRCDAWCCVSCCLCNNVMEVYKNGELFGSIKQKFSVWSPRFTIYHGDDEVATVKAPCCPCRCSMYMNMQIEGDKNEHSPGLQGDITKVHVPSEEYNTDHETFEVNFGDAEVKNELKLLCLGAGFLMNLMYFEVS